MKKTYKFILLPLLTLLIFSGCEKIDNEPQSSASGSSKSSVQEETSAESENEPVLININTDGKKGNDGIDAYESLCQQKFKINFSVVIIDDLGGRSAKEYAENSYKKLYGGADGVLFLINNDTGNDYILRKGAPANFISDSDVTMLLTKISPMLVTENYTDAVKSVCELFEQNLPKFAIDRTGKMKKEEITEINNMLSEVSDGTESLSVIYVKSTDGKKLADYAKAQEEKLFTYTDSGSHAVMIVNTENAECYICGYGGFVTVEDNQEGIKKFIADCLTETDGKKSFNYKSAAEIFVKFMGK